ncbi:hypothetical protein HP567_018395 [Brevibacillus sp. M2.1A]|uniref:hypothetical protein n=1 Tax=Brevibacillus TaxID=55080 RepID=UPI00156AE7A9|nr:MULTISPECIES: hypothetical protein [Brevibacillus]MBY0087470.1 hypothetical protein [Brevibacillus brevis]MCC8436519.1 hypothetical protein [Brevibacillus sp. M2.1A]
MLTVNEKEKVTPTQLAQILHMTPSTITRFVDQVKSVTQMIHETVEMLEGSKSESGFQHL